MNKEFLIRLTNNLYQITLLFPKKEPLRYKMREIADEILSDFISYSYFCSQGPENPQKSNKYENQAIAGNLYRLLEVMNGFFAIADVQNWVSSQKLLSVWEEYSKIKEYTKELNKKSSFSPLLPVNQEKEEDSEIVAPKVHIEKTREEPVARNSSRQEKILEFLKENGKAQVGEFKTIFPEVTKRTLRRDFRFLLKQGIIERIGERNETYYQISSRT